MSVRISIMLLFVHLSQCICMTVFPVYYAITYILNIYIYYLFIYFKCRIHYYYYYFIITTIIIIQLQVHIHTT